MESLQTERLETHTSEPETLLTSQIRCSVDKVNNHIRLANP